MTHQHSDPTVGDETSSEGNPRRRAASSRVRELLADMTVQEKAYQLVGYWAAASQPGQPVAPRQDHFSGSAPDLDDIVSAGVGQLTRPYGTAPVAPAEGLTRLRSLQDQIVSGNRFAIPAIVHEECLTGFATLGATAFPTPLAWGATFDPNLVEEMAYAIGSSMRRMGVHQGLAPVLDVTRDYRWGRTEETIGEDPQLVGIVGAAYVRGLERAGIVATLKHFAGYSASRGGRNLAPASLGHREFMDVVVEPFAIALRHGNPRSVMHSYADVDGVPAAADTSLLTELLRRELGFTGLVVADYFGVSFLETLHRVAESPGQAAHLALRAGVDVELPTVRCYGEPLVGMVQAGSVPEKLLDRSVERVLALKEELGLLDGGWQADFDQVDDDGASYDLDPPAHRALARRVAEQSVVVLQNNGLLPLSPGTGSVAVVGPLAHDHAAMLGCYTFPRHVDRHHPERDNGLHIPTLFEALQQQLPHATLRLERGCDVRGELAEEVLSNGVARAADVAGESDFCVLVLGDLAGMFGHGTSGEGTDAPSLRLPGSQQALAEAVLARGTPVVLVLLSGRPYALGDLADRAAAVVQAFFPGEEGGPAVAGVLCGQVEPSGRLPVSVPREVGGEPGTYLHAPLAGDAGVSSIVPTPLFPFGHGLTWTEFAYRDLEITDEQGGEPQVPTNGTVLVRATVVNVGDHEGTEIVQLYLSDPVASVVRPVRWLVGWARVLLTPGESAQVEFRVHADRTSFTGVTHERIVEPGVVEVGVGSSSGSVRLHGSFVLAGQTRRVGADRVLDTPARVITIETTSQG